MSTDITSKIIGTWRLISCMAQASDGQVSYPYGKNAQGRAYLEPDRFAFQVLNPERRRFPSVDPRSASDAEMREAFEGYLAYYGSLSIHPENGTIVNRVEAATIPNWVGTDQVRYYRFENDRLVLRTPPMLRGGVEFVNTIVWERLT
jgi:Lipocalin-like domain